MTTSPAPVLLEVETPALPLSEIKYALITPARNEAEFIGNTLCAMVAQTVRPQRWVIVSDGSTDGTDEIVRNYARQYSWIVLVRMPEHRDRNFAAKVRCFQAGYAQLAGCEFDYIGNLDADISFEPDYLEFLLEKFESWPDLGVAGTPFVEDLSNPDNHTYAHGLANLKHVSGACQLFRRSCFEAVGGYVPVKGGAIDWIAVTTARMRGWQTRTFTEKVCVHHRQLGTGNNRPLLVPFHYGCKAYNVGGHPLWEFLRGCFQMTQRPWFIGGLMFLCGFFWSMLLRRPRVVSAEVMAFHRNEQMARLRGIFAPRSPARVANPLA